MEKYIKAKTLMIIFLHSSFGGPHCNSVSSEDRGTESGISKIIVAKVALFRKEERIGNRISDCSRDGNFPFPGKCDSDFPSRFPLKASGNNGTGNPSVFARQTPYF